MLNQTVKFDQNVLTIVHKGKAKNNKISSTLYNWYNFIPLGLWNQITQITNMWFIFICILTMIPIFKTVNPYSKLFPLGIVIGFSLFLDYYEDLKRYRQDREINNKNVRVIRERKFLEIKSQDIKVGDIQILSENERASADLVVLTFQSCFEYAFIDTKTLDGEKTLKPKICLLKKINEMEEMEINLDNFQIDYEQNTRSLHRFNGRVHINDETASLDLTHFIPQTASVKNTNQVYGLVVFIGKDTKISLNMQKRIFKLSSMEKNLNYYILWVFGFMLILLITLAIISVSLPKKDTVDDLYGLDDSKGVRFFITIVGYLILMNQFLPISLIITLRLINIFQKLEFEHSKIYDDPMTNKKAFLQTLNVSHELGQLEYILTDKTGTLTQNKMICKNFQIGNQVMELNGDTQQYQQTKDSKFNQITLQSNDKQSQLSINNQQELEKIFLYLVNSCHTCFAMYDHYCFEQVYQGPSPDEVSILIGLKQYARFFVKDTSLTNTVIQDKSDDSNLIVKKIIFFDFDSDRKLMSCIVEIQGQYFMFAKGADNAMIQRSFNDLTEEFKISINKFYEQGYRIMFMGVKILSNNEVDDIMKTILEKEKQVDQEDLYNYKKNLEDDFYIIGCSVIEDKLQEDLKDTLYSFKQANIKVWMITGDKRDTAINVAYQAGLFDDTNPLFFEGALAERVINKKLTKTNQQKENYFMKKLMVQSALMATNSTNFDLGLKNSINDYIENLERNNKNLVVNSFILHDALQNKHTKKRFYRFLRNFQCVVFCRTNPHQKVEIVRLLQKRNLKVLAIGDGQNDVNMIQEANVGVGIIGEEGNQAQNASDIAIPKFKLLKPLLFSFGRQVYQRNSTHILLFFYKNLIFAIPQFYFAFFCIYSRRNFYNDWFMSFYNIFFTAYLIPTMTVSNRDLDSKAPYHSPNLLEYIYTYFYGQKNLYFSKLKFAQWFITPMLESLYIFIMNYLFYRSNPYYNHHQFQWELNGLIYLTIVFYFQTIKTFFITFRFQFYYFLGLFLNFLSFYLFMIISNNFSSFGIKNGLQKTYGIPSFYLLMIFQLGSLIFFTHLYYFTKRYIFPQMKDKIRQIKNRQNETEYEWFLSVERQRMMEKVWFQLFQSLDYHQFNYLILQRIFSSFTCETFPNNINSIFSKRFSILCFSFFKIIDIVNLNDFVVVISFRQLNMISNSSSSSEPASLKISIIFIKTGTSI